MIGIIGGTGLEKIDIFTNPQSIKVETEYGFPSSEIVTGEINDKKIALLSRHGREHTITPTHVNNRANISALKKLGCEIIIATTACGSLRENYKPGDFVLPNQFIDFTKHRINTFYESFKPGEMQHCAMANPFDLAISERIYNTACELEIQTHKSGTVISIEGPRFSTKAESNMFRLWGADIINMSTAPEAALANEAGLKYCVIAIVTDYDCWKEGEEEVSMELVIKNFHKSIDKVINLLTHSITKI